MASEKGADDLFALLWLERADRVDERTAGLQPLRRTIEQPALQLGPFLMGLSDQFRFEPVTKRIRAFHDGQPVLDTTQAALVWEPRRVVPMYAVPEADVAAALRAALRR